MASRYQLLQQLGSHRYLGVDTLLERKVEVHQIPYEDLGGRDGDWWLKRARPLLRLDGVDRQRLLDLSLTEDEGLLVVSEPVTGTALPSRVFDEGAPDQSLLRHIFRLLSLLQSAHAQGVVHGALSEAAVRVDVSGNVYLAHLTESWTRPDCVAADDVCAFGRLLQPRATPGSRFAALADRIAGGELSLEDCHGALNRLFPDVGEGPVGAGLR